MANMYIGNEDDARKNAILCEKMADKIGREYEHFQSMLIKKYVRAFRLERYMDM